MQHTHKSSILYTLGRITVGRQGGEDMRTNVVLDDELVDRARELTGIRTKKGVITEALKLLVRIREQQGILKLRGKVDWEGDLDEMREGRFLDVDR